jgi:hypothetical protein
MKKQPQPLTKRSVPVSTRAVIARINRKISDTELAFKTTRGTKWLSDLGSYYVVNLRTNAIDQPHCTPEKYARDIGVLKPYEFVKD